jgi:hypothetical protein
MVLLQSTLPSRRKRLPANTEAKKHSEQMYKKRFDKWHLQKNLREEDMRFAMQVLMEKASERTIIMFDIHGAIVYQEDVERYWRRRGSTNSMISTKTLPRPPHIRVVVRARRCGNSHSTLLTPLKKSLQGSIWSDVPRHNTASADQALPLQAFATPAIVVSPRLRSAMSAL